MTEPKHWLDESSDADPFERGILRSGLDPDPSEARRAQVWAQIAGALALAPLTASSATGGAKLTLSSSGKLFTVCAGVGKGFLIGLAVYGATAGASMLSERLTARRTHPVPTAAPVSNTQHAVPALAISVTVPTAQPGFVESAVVLPAASPPASVIASHAASSRPAFAVASPKPLLSATTVTSPAASGSQLQAEALALRTARGQLRAGQLADAFATLEASRRQFSAPELYQEREALLIELLYRTGQVAAARERAAAFLRRFPDSPHIEQIQRLNAR